MWMPATIVGERLTDDAFEEEFARLAESMRAEGNGGGDGRADEPGEGGERPSPARAWPVVPAVVVTGIIAALLTAFGMVTQIWANMAGAQLPGS
jgi:hypothetical protein